MRDPACSARKPSDSVKTDRLRGLSDNVVHAGNRREREAKLPDKPVHTDLVLIGGGHAQLAVLRAFGIRPEPGVRLTLIAKEAMAPYSGMVPGYLAGIYGEGDNEVDLVKLARFAGARLIHAAASAVDPQARRVLFADRPPLDYDVLSIDVGILPEVGAVAGAGEHALTVKPISRLNAKWRALRESRRSIRRAVVVGGGAAGFELAHALNTRLSRKTGEHGAIPPSVTLVAGRRLLPGLAKRARSLAERSLQEAGIRLVLDRRADRVEPNAVVLDDGENLSSDLTMVATSAKAPEWLGASGLSTDEAGYLLVDRTLQVRDRPEIFAAGDCVTLVGQERPKAGVFAVRQGEVLADNLRRFARGGALRPYNAQTHYLFILSLGGRDAIATRNGLAARGRWAFELKDRIERRFIARYTTDLAPLNGADAGHPANRQRTARRLGGTANASPISRTDPRPRPEEERWLGRDRMAITADRASDRKVGTGFRTIRCETGRLEHDTRFRDRVSCSSATIRGLETLDFFRAFWPDPFRLGQITAEQAMSVIFARGGRVEHGQLLALPGPDGDAASERDISQLAAGARRAVENAGASLVAGHGNEASELSLALSVSGTVADEDWIPPTVPGEPMALILTRALGTGFVLAAEARRRAAAPLVLATLEDMERSNAPVAACLRRHRATATGALTGRHLADVLGDMLAGSGMGARLATADLPVRAGVHALFESGDTLASARPTRSGDEDRVTGGTPSAVALLFDVQTAGGLLAALPVTTAAACLAELHCSGIAPDAAVIGETATDPGETIALLDRHLSGAPEDRSGGKAETEQDRG